MTDEREAHVVGVRPLAMLRDGLDDAKGKAVARQGFQNLRFGELQIVQHDGENLRVPLGEERAGRASGAAAAERDLLSQGKLRKARDQLSFGIDLQLGGSAGKQWELHQSHEIELANQAETREARCSRVERESALDAVIFQERLAAGASLLE